MQAHFPTVRSCGSIHAMIRHVALLATLPLLAAPACGQEAPSPTAIVADAPTGEWVVIAPDDLLVMDLAPDRDPGSGARAGGKPRRVVIQLMPPPFSQGWIDNIRTLARAGWWDGTSVNRVQDNYVAQWGDATEAKPLPDGLKTQNANAYLAEPSRQSQLEAFSQSAEVSMHGARVQPKPYQDFGWRSDPYAFSTGFWRGWPVAASEAGFSWPVHCYATVGVGRNLSPDTGTGAELYAVIGHAPRHLDRNIAIVGRVVEGIEHLSSLPRGTGDLGFYETAAERVPIRSVRLASALPAAERPRFEYMNTEGQAFARYAEARANRRDPFFIVPAGGADICNVPVPVRRVKE